MKTSHFLFIPLLFFCAIFSSCEKDELPENPHNPISSNYTGSTGNTNPGNNSGSTGRLIFWSNFSGSPISVSVDGIYRGEITTVLGSAPSCGASGCVTVALSPGTHSYTASDGTYSWGNSFTISSNTCFRQLLTL